MVRRSGTCLLSIVIAMSYGCARPLPPAPSRITETQGPIYRFSSMPQIVVEDQPIAPFRLDPEEKQALEKAREEFNKAREQRIRQIKDRHMSGLNSVGGMTFQCVLYTAIVFSPVCIFFVPFAYGMESWTSGAWIARSQPYMPAAPSERELSAVHEKIRGQLTASGMAHRLRTSLPNPYVVAAEEFPRLLITPSSVTFSAERTFLVKFLVQGQPSADVSWPQTEHVYHVGYQKNTRHLMTELRQGESRLAESISTTYGLWGYVEPERLAAPDDAGPGPM